MDEGNVFFAGPGEMRALCRAFDWSATSLGPVDRWPPSLRTTVQIVLASRLPMMIAWWPDLRMIYNEGYRDLIGSRHPAAFGAPGIEFWPEYRDFTIDIHRRVRGGESVWLDDVSFPMERIPGIVEQTWFHVIYSPVRDDTLAVGGTLTACIETTARKQAEFRLAFLLKLADGLRGLEDVSAIQDTACALLGEHLGVNRCTYVDIQGGNFIVQSSYVSGVAALPPGPISLGPFSGWVLDTLRRGDNVAAEDVSCDPRITQAALAAYREIEMGAMAAVSIVKDQELVAVLGVSCKQPRRWSATDLQLLRDVADRIWAAVERATERRRAHEAEIRLREKANEANQAKDQFLALLGHELRNPLTPILAILDLMRSEGKKTWARERAIMERHARQLARLVDDLLDVTRIARGKVKLDLNRVDLARVVARALEMTSPMLDQGRHRVQVETAPGLIVQGDEDRLVQVVTNLLTNAAKYTPPEGHIDIRLSRDPSGIALRVRDDGHGIDPGLLPHVFDHFRQGAQSLDRSQGGLGIGLSIVRNLVELHGGRVTAESDGPDLGTTMTVHLPAAAAAVPAPLARRPTPRRKPAAPTAGAHRLLVVDDNEDFADVLATLLRKRGHQVEVAYSAGKALERAKSFRPSVALLDIGLPEMDGLELGRRLRADRTSRDMNLIAITGYGQPSDRKQALRAGFVDHLIKPVDFDRLTKLLGQLPAAETASGSPAARSGRRSGRRARVTTE